MVPTIEDLRKARDLFEKNEPRDLFYRVATELVALAIDGKSSLSTAEALAVLLQTWNASYYRYRHFTAAHFGDLERIVGDHEDALRTFRARSVTTLCEQDSDPVKRTFREFELVLHPVGAAKCLHLLAPGFFPLWDRAIAAAYGVPLAGLGRNQEGYWQFMTVVREQCNRLASEGSSMNLLKALDEFNYCKYTKKWIKE